MGPHKHKKPYLRSYHHKLERTWLFVDVANNRCAWSSSLPRFQGISTFLRRNTWQYVTVVSKQDVLYRIELLPFLHGKNLLCKVLTPYF